MFTFLYLGGPEEKPYNQLPAASLTSKLVTLISHKVKINLLSFYEANYYVKFQRVCCKWHLQSHNINLASPHFPDHLQFELFVHG